MTNGAAGAASEEKSFSQSGRERAAEMAWAMWWAAVLQAAGVWSLMT